MQIAMAQAESVKQTFVGLRAYDTGATIGAAAAAIRWCTTGRTCGGR